MKIQVKLNSTYKWAIIEEDYEVNIEEQDVLDFFGASTLDDIQINELGQLVLNGYGQLVSNTILDVGDCKEDRIVNVEVVQ